MPGATSSGGGYNPAFGGIPQLPMPTSTQGSAIQGDLGNLGSILSLINGLDASQQAQLLSQYNTAIPGYSNLTKTASGVTQQNLEGQVPQDVISQLTQQAAERGISTGMPGSGNSNAAYLRALGLTSLGQEQTGMQNLATMTQTAPVAPLYNPASLLVTPEQQQQAAGQQAIFNAAPIPAAAAAKAIQIGNSAGSAASTPWWAQGSGAVGAMGPGTTQTGPGIYHTPNANLAF